MKCARGANVCGRGPGPRGLACALCGGAGTGRVSLGLPSRDSTALCRVL